MDFCWLSSRFALLTCCQQPGPAAVPPQGTSDSFRGSVGRRTTTRTTTRTRTGSSTDSDISEMRSTEEDVSGGGVEGQEPETARSARSEERGLLASSHMLSEGVRSTLMQVRPGSVWCVLMGTENPPCRCYCGLDQPDQRHAVTSSMLQHAGHVLLSLPVCSCLSQDS